MAEKFDHFDLWKIYSVFAHAVVAYFSSDYHVLWKYELPIRVDLSEIETGIYVKSSHMRLLVGKQTYLGVVDLQLDVFHIEVFYSVD